MRLGKITKIKIKFMFVLSEKTSKDRIIFLPPHLSFSPHSCHYAKVNHIKKKKQWQKAEGKSSTALQGKAIKEHNIQLTLNLHLMLTNTVSDLLRSGSLTVRLRHDIIRHHFCRPSFKDALPIPER